MVKYKNITIKKKGGGTRKQRVKVLASGKYKFVKNLNKRVKSRVTRRKTTKRKNNPKRRKTNLARKKKKGGGGKSFTTTAFKLVRLGALLAPGAAAALNQSWDTRTKIRVAMRRYTGYDPQHHGGTFKLEWLAEGWTPYLGACAATYLILKITGLIRRIF